MLYFNSNLVATLKSALLAGNSRPYSYSKSFSPRLERGG